MQARIYTAFPLSTPRLRAVEAINEARYGAGSAAEEDTAKRLVKAVGFGRRVIAPLAVAAMLLGATGGEGDADRLRVPAPDAELARATAVFIASHEHYAGAVVKSSR